MVSIILDKMHFVAKFYPYFHKYFKMILYSLVRQFLLNLIDKNVIIYKYQFGFRKKHSTRNAITTLVDRISPSMDSGDPVTFDSVDYLLPHT